MGNALKSLIRINHMQRQLTEKKIKDLRYKKTQIETEIADVQVKMNVAEQTVYEKPTGPHPHMDVLNVLQWKSIQTKKIEILKLAIVDLERQQSTLKKDMCQLIDRMLMSLHLDGYGNKEIDTPQGRILCEVSCYFYPWDLGIHALKFCI